MSWFENYKLVRSLCSQCANMVLTLSQHEAGLRAKEIETKYLESVVADIIGKYNHQADTKEVEMHSSFKKMAKELLEALQSAKTENMRLDCQQKDMLSELNSLRAAMANEHVRCAEEISQLRISGNSWLQQVTDLQEKLEQQMQIEDHSQALLDENSKLRCTIESLTDIVNSNMEYNQMEEEGTLPEKEDLTCYGWTETMHRKQAANARTHEPLKQIQSGGPILQMLCMYLRH